MPSNACETLYIPYPYPTSWIPSLLLGSQGYIITSHAKRVRSIMLILAPQQHALPTATSKSLDEKRACRFIWSPYLDA